jgi:hypothetical protein
VGEWLIADEEVAIQDLDLLEVPALLDLEVQVGGL